MKRKLKYLVVIFFITQFSQAQCAMCKAVVEANLKEGGSAGAGLNEGILYLMSMPYIAVFSFALFYYLQKRKKQIA